MTEPSRDPAIQSQIAKLAHDLWEKEGRPDGRDAAHWTQAESEVLAGLADHMIPGELAAPADTVKDADPLLGGPDTTKSPASPVRKPATKRRAPSGRKAE